MASVSGLGVDGLVSGLDTTSLINSLMTAEAEPQTQLKTQVTNTQTTITALQGLNTQIASLTTLATTSKSSTSLSLFTTTSSSANATATAGTNATAGTFDVVVNQVAQAKVGVSAAMSTWPASGSGSTTPAVTIVKADGTKVDVTPSSNSIDAIVTAINASSTAGVKALKVAAGTDSSGTAQYRIQLQSTTTGAQSDFQIYSGTSSDVDAGTATNILTATGAAVIKPAQDAQVTLYAGTAAEQKISSSTNTFSDLLPGVNLTVNKASTDSITVGVAQDTAGATAVASGLVSALNGVFALISTKSAVVNSTDSSGNKVVSGGPFTGDSTVRGANDALVSAASMPINGHSPSEIGISINKDGTLDFDQDKFQTALASDPAGTQSMLSALASRVADAGTQISDKYSGQLTGVITGQQSMVDTMNDQISQWDIRLAARRTALEAQYSNLEVQLSQLNSQSSSLTSGLASVPAVYTGA
ncbi:flagellar filament capping protein FliD [Frondihabitans australicus]|uniref:Flagellar hook-associated protein 2 n=1 Tax=Frondihabitans australicus TaxID=386892 RepID=A0A495IKB5_9MICO|nr:flagellar filament capping protein FliD [Frondihabitans australicus]RKR75576.1 flagellar hook-associated protein 2 [Frondihabitans australicus]